MLSREHCDCGVAVFVHTDGVDDAAVSVLSVIQAAQVSDGLSCKLVLQDIKKMCNYHIRQSMIDWLID